MLDIINIILPVFALIGLGYLVAVTRLLTMDVSEAVAKFVFVIAIPALLMKTMATADFSGANPWIFWAAYFSGVAIVWLLARIIIFNLFGRDQRSAVIAGVAAGFSNIVLTGIPIINRAYGEEGVAILLLLVAIHMPVMMTASTLLMEQAVRADGIEKSPYNLKGLLTNITKNLITNPIIMGIIAGLIWRISTIPYSGLLADTAATMGATAGPLALFSVGMSLNKYGIKSNLLQGSLLASLSLIIFPAVVYVLTIYMFHLPVDWARVAVISAALPTGVNAYLFATHFKVAEGLATNTIILTILGSIVTLSFWLWVMS
jgi:malonate transporter